MWRVLLSAVFFLMSASLPAADDVVGAVRFETHVRPILKAHCWHCHGEGEEIKGALDARLARSLLKGGDSGPAIVGGDHAKSLLFERVSAGEMPPNGKQLSAAEIDMLARWIDEGVKTVREEPASLPPGHVFSEEERNHWSFQPIKRPAVPVLKKGTGTLANGRVNDDSENGPRASPLIQQAAKELVRTPIDAFLLAALEAKQLSFGPPADRATLIRRVYFDLTGLPPSPEAVEKFVNNATPDAYEKIVDELLASPAYGEHWGRHWLDVVGYADSDGYGVDPPRKWAYRYRDYVIRAINNDKPWNEFIVEQLAGDELLTPPYTNLTPEQADKLIATGMLRMAPDGTSDGAVEQNLARNEVIANTIKIVSTSLLGLTVGCAQCHDHRYDPISHVDYHAIRAVFEPAYDWQHWRSANERLINLWTEETRKKAAAVEVELKQVGDERNAELDKIVAQVFDRELAKLPAESQPAARAAHDAPADKRTPEQNELIKQHPFLNVNRSTVYLYLPDRLTKFNKEWDDRTEATRKKMPADDFVRCLTEVPGQIPITKLFARGDYNVPKQEIPPAELAILDADGFKIAADDPQLPTSGRRLAYARHLTDGKHPLVARVLVNRFWLNHFGRGLVTSPGDFGALGQRPSHPELLDWLADDFMAGGWKLKRLQRMIVTSTAYRQSSQHRPELDAVDPENHLLGRMNVHRLEAEMLRDAMLATSGKLCSKMFGAPIPITPDDVGQIVVGVDTRDSSGRPTGKFVDIGDEEFRRSIYVQVQRSKPLGMLETFDAPLMAPNCELRTASTNAPQSLLLMNNTFVLQQAEAMAKRIEQEVGGDVGAQFQRAWQLAFCHAPTESQSQAGVAFLGEQATLIAASSPAAESGEAKAAKDAKAEVPEPSHIALANLCQALVISNGFLYVE